MKRKYWLIAVVALVAGTAMWLRVRSDQRASRQPSDQYAHARRVVPSLLPVPRDYVADPMVAPEEASAGPKRIVSLAPSITEIVCALGMRDRLVGRTRYCKYPPGIESVATVGVMAESNYGQMQALEPELILATRNSGQTVSDLHKLGLNVQSVPHETLEDIEAAIERIGHLCGRPRTAAALARAIRADWDRLVSLSASRGKPRRTLVLFGELPVPPKAVFVAGPGLFLDRLIECPGHRNAARDVLKNASQGEIPLELLRVVNPEVILEFRDAPRTPAQVDELYRAWSRVGPIEAIRRRQVIRVGGLEWLSAGPRVAIELHRFIAVLSEAE